MIRRDARCLVLAALLAPVGACGARAGKPAEQVPAAPVRAGSKVAVTIAPGACEAAKTHASEFSGYVARCEQGDPESCTHEGVFYVCGTGVPEDLHRALALFLSACDRGFLKACVNASVGMQISDVAPDEQARVFQALRRSCDGHDDSACFNLSVGVLTMGYGSASDVAPALTFLTKSCHDGAVDACGHLAEIYAGTAPDRVPRDLARAVSIGAPACDKGGAVGAMACFAVGIAYWSGYGGGDGKARAREYFERACGAGLSVACFNLAGILFQQPAPDLTRIKALLSQACDGGVAPACTQLVNASLSK